MWPIEASRTSQLAPGFGAVGEDANSSRSDQSRHVFPDRASDHNLANNLQPNGTWFTGRAFYAMQTGTRTSTSCRDVYGGALGPWSWGLSYRARLPLEVDPEGYMWGNYQEGQRLGRLRIGSPASRRRPARTSTFKAPCHRQDDGWIIGGSQVADANFYGGKRIELFGGASLDGKLLGFPGA